MLKAQLAVQTAKLRRENEGQLLKGQFSFRSLPGELRNRIWEQALCEPREFCLDTMRCPPLAMVSHDMMREALLIFFAVNTFHVVFLKKKDGSGYEMEILPQTLAWLQGIHEQTFNNIPYKNFLTKMVLIKHLTFTNINKVEDRNGEDNKEFRIDYDYTEQSKEKKTHLATKSMNKIPHKKWVTHSTDANIIRQLQIVQKVRRSKQLAAQLERNQIANEFTQHSGLKKTLHNGMTLSAVMQLAKVEPMGMLKFVHSRSIRMRTTLAQPGSRSWIMRSVMGC